MAFNADRWVGLHAFRVDDAGHAHPLATELTRGQGLVFAYTNLGPRPQSHLMIFAVDGGGRVYWYHPAYSRAGTNPSSIAIEPGRERVELPQVVRHDLNPGWLRLYGVFSRRPLQVEQVEGVVARLTRMASWSNHGPPSRLPLAETAQHSFAVEVHR